MSRLLLIIAIAAVIYLLVRSYRKPAQQQDKPTEDMVRCAHCGVHLPKGESVQADGHSFCGVEHRDAYRK